MSGSWWITRMPAACASAGARRRTGAPSIATSPVSGWCTPSMMRASVDLPGAVLADQRQDLARPDRQGDVRQRLHNAEALADAANLQQRPHFLQSLPLKSFQSALSIRSALT